MRRALNFFGTIALTALITYLWIRKDLAEQQAAHLSLALANAETRVASLEAEAALVEQELQELKAKRESQRVALSSSRTTRTTVAATRADYATDNRTIIDGSGLAGTAAPLADNAMTGHLGPWYSLAVVSSAGSFVRIEGTSSLHNWQVESHLITGSAQFGSELPANTGSARSAVPQTELDVKASVSIPVRSLKSVDASGKPYSDRMDDIIYDKLQARSYSRITYTLTSLTLREQPDETSTNFFYDTIGQLGIAGVTNTVTMPVALTPAPGGLIQFAGSVQLKMSDFNISPPAPSFDGIRIKTGDVVRLSFVWWVRPLASMAANK
jgi:hypothetical protein